MNAFDVRMFRSVNGVLRWDCHTCNAAGFCDIGGNVPLFFHRAVIHASDHLYAPPSLKGENL